MTQEEKLIIESIIDKSDKIRHEKTMVKLLYGEENNEGGGCLNYIDNKYSKKLKDIVRKFYSKINFDDAYTVFASGFQMHLENMDEDYLRSVDSLWNWLGTVGKNYALEIKKDIDVFKLISSNPGGSVADEGRLSDDSEDDELDDDNIKDDEEEEINTNQEPDDITKIQDDIVEEVPDYYEGSKQKQSYAEWRFRHYLSKVTNETYRDLIEAIKINNADRSELAEEYGWTEERLNTKFNRAWDALIAVALEDIKRCEPALFKKYEYHTDMDENTAAVLHDFFDSNNSIKQMAVKYNLNEYKTRLKIVSAYKNLLDIQRREMKILELETYRDEKKQKRLKRLYNKYKKVLRETDSRSYLLLFKYYTFFGGDFDDMAKNEINNNITPKELANKLDKAYEFLDRIEKERTKRDNK